MSRMHYTVVGPRDGKWMNSWSNIYDRGIGIHDAGIGYRVKNCKMRGVNGGVSRNVRRN